MEFKIKRKEQKMGKNIAILGAGNAGWSCAADLTLRGHSVRFFSRTEKNLVPLKKAGGIEVSGIVEGLLRLTE